MTRQSRRRFFPFSSGLAALPVFLAPLAASAQQVSSEVTVQTFDAAPGADNYFSTRALRMNGKMNWTAGLLVNYGYRPFVVRQGASGNLEPQTYYTVENIVTGDAMASLTILPALQVGLKVPVTWAKGQGIPGQELNSDPEVPAIDAVGVGDIQFEAKYRFYGAPGGPAAFGLYGFVNAPTGNLTAPGTYIGNASVAGGGSVIGDFQVGALSMGVNLGGIFREEATVGQTTLGPMARFSAAAAYQLGPVFRLVGDVFGSTNFASAAGGHGVELHGGAQVTPLGSKLTFTAGGGAGVLKGIGVPDARIFVGFIYDGADLDRDGDGIPDNVDACPTDAEDFDGFEDGDGCPEYDNDNDGIPDSADKCPNKAEDRDGFEDGDGCPEPDNDNDGIPDVADRCPNEPETMNGFNDLDGCPDIKDTDGDGVPDDKDQCPDEPEDTDGFEDTDGCPDPDNDGDGVPDDQDECIDEPEDGKGTGTQPTDGCPFEA